MQEITAADYHLFYTGIKMIHKLYYNGQAVVQFRQSSRYYIITLRNGVSRTLRDTDTLQVRNTNLFTI